MKEGRIKADNSSGIGFSFNKVPWASDGYYLDERLTFTFDPLFHAGCYYVQEASSMFVGRCCGSMSTSPVVMLDLCAAPEGINRHAACFRKESAGGE